MTDIIQRPYPWHNGCSFGMITVNVIILNIPVSATNSAASPGSNWDSIFPFQLDYHTIPVIYTLRLF